MRGSTTVGLQLLTTSIYLSMLTHVLMPSVFFELNLYEAIKCHIPLDIISHDKNRDTFILSSMFFLFFFYTCCRLQH